MCSIIVADVMVIGCAVRRDYILANPQVPANTATAAPQLPTLIAAREIEVQPPCDHSRSHPA